MDDEAKDKAEEKTEIEVKDENKVEDKSTVEGENQRDDKEGLTGEPAVKDETARDESAGKEPDSQALTKSASDQDNAKEKEKDAKEAPVSQQKLSAPEKMASVVPTKTARRQPGDLSIFDLAVGVLLLALMSQLVANSYIAYLGRSYNDRVCKESIALASESANKGEDTPHVQLAAFGSMLHCPMDGLFIEHPELISFSDEIDPAKKTRIITICSSTKVRVPAAFLVLDKSCLVNRFDVFPEIAFKTTYQYKLTNAKGIDGKYVRDSSGKLISRPPRAVKGAKTKDSPPARPGEKPATPSSETKTGDKAVRPAPGADAKTAPASGTGDAH